MPKAMPVSGKLKVLVRKSPYQRQSAKMAPQKQSSVAVPLRRPPPTPACPIAALPDEILIQMFQQVDSVTRTRCERVCRRWNDLLRHTGSLQKDLVIDIGVLTTGTTTARRSPRLKKAELEDDLFNLLSSKHPQTLRVTDESNPTKPWLTQEPVHKDQLCELLPMVALAVSSYRRPPALPALSVTLEKLTVSGGNLRQFVGNLARDTHPLPRLEFRDVKVVALSLSQLRDGAKHYGVVRLPQLHLDRKDVTSGLVRLITGRMSLPAADGKLSLDLLTLMGAHDGPLTAVEEEAYQEIAEEGFDRPTKQTYKTYLGLDVSRAALQSATDFSSFVQRLLIYTD